MEFRGEAERQIANLEENIAAHHNQVGKIRLLVSTIRYII